MTTSPRMTGPALKILGQLLNDPQVGLSGADISKETGLRSGTLYPILIRLESAGWLSSEWEEIDPREAGRPRKRLYRLTSLGSRESKAAFNDLVPLKGRVLWQS